MFDVVIRGGMVLDGTGGPAFRADVGLAGARITAVGPLPGAQAARLHRCSRAR
jgi:N-acyl-D-amino-acid deacylase